MSSSSSQPACRMQEKTSAAERQRMLLRRAQKTEWPRAPFTVWPRKALACSTPVAICQRSCAWRSNAGSTSASGVQAWACRASTIQTECSHWLAIDQALATGARARCDVNQSESKPSCREDITVQRARRQRPLLRAKVAPTPNRLQSGSTESCFIEAKSDKARCHSDTCRHACIKFWKQFRSGSTQSCTSIPSVSSACVQTCARQHAEMAAEYTDLIAKLLENSSSRRNAESILSARCHKRRSAHSCTA
mmetsp:Transcript_146681/g.468549  ORF Transcript_146681/g.468549 Transcript_146681/m.468549 type:complete len:249 (+) Transcript_146681:434-1180(+)